MKKLIMYVFVLIMTALTVANAQTSKKEKKAAKALVIRNMIDSQKYVFEADYVTPLRGGTRILTSDYDLRVTKDSVIAYLPYFGRAYLAAYNPTDGGIKFTSTNFSYKVIHKKNGSWDIVIKPKENNITDWRDVQQLILNISTSGYASLIVLSSSRDQISFSGYLKEPVEKKAKEITAAKAEK